MKKTIGIMGSIALCLLGAAANAQQPWDAKKNATVDSITSQYAGKYIAPRPAVTTADIFPVIGKYASTTNTDAAAISIMLDEQNKGLVWIVGLPQGRIKAMLRKSPATYKIPAQKTENGKDVAEGTLIFDKETNVLNIAIGKNYNAENPAIVFVPAEAKEEPVVVKGKKVKTKKVKEPKAWMYTGNKLEKETVLN